MDEMPINIRAIFKYTGNFTEGLSIVELIGIKNVYLVKQNRYHVPPDKHPVYIDNRV
jgi:hypothetical protein